MSECCVNMYVFSVAMELIIVYKVQKGYSKPKSTKGIVYLGTELFSLQIIPPPNAFILE